MRCTLFRANFAVVVSLIAFNPGGANAATLHCSELTENYFDLTIVRVQPDGSKITSLRSRSHSICNCDVGSLRECEVFDSLFLRIQRQGYPMSVTTSVFKPLDVRSLGLKHQPWRLHHRLRLRCRHSRRLEQTTLWQLLHRLRCSYQLPSRCLCRARLLFGRARLRFRR